MGFFTWTLANITPVKARHGDFLSRCKLGYGGFAAVVCPDNTVIKENSYDGYGMFNDKDIYELVVDWNRQHLEEIFDKLAEVNNCNNYWGYYLRDMAIAYQNYDTKTLNDEITRLLPEYPYIKTDWKRNIGIAISVEHNDLLPYPIKITNNKRPKPYDELLPSISCQ